jgi:Putative Ig domain
VFAVLAGVFVATAMALRFDDASCKDQDPCSPPTGVIGKPYQHKLTGEGGNGAPYSYFLRTGAIPPGTSLNGDTGLISGTPTSSGTAHFGVELQDNPKPAPDWCVTRNSCAYQEFTIVVLSGLSIDNQSVAPGTIGQAYSQQLTATNITSLNPPAGPPANATWSLNSGTVPPGLTLGANGLLSGAPTTAGSFQFVVRAALDATRVDTETLTLVVRAPVAIAAPTVPKSEIGVAFRLAPTASGGTGGPYAWTLANGTLPAGLVLDPATGAVTGTPTAAGSFRFTSRATDTEGRIGEYSVSLTVASTLAITTQLLRPAKVGKLYRAKVASAGGIIPKLWKISKGPLPRGIRFDRTTGLLSGTPTKAGRYRVTFQVTDGLNVVAKKTLRIDVLGPPA